MKRPVLPPLAIPLLVAGLFLAGWFVSRNYRIPSFVWETGEVARPATVRTVSLEVRGLKCRHGSLPMKDLLFGRGDDHAIQGYFRAVLFPSPGAGEMVVTFDPARTDVKRIAQAVKLDAEGQETAYRVLLEVKPDLSSPAAVLHTLSRALEDRHEELFLACHASGAGGVDFNGLVQAWMDLFLEDIRPAGPPDEKGRVELLGVIGGEALPLDQLGGGMTSLVIGREGDRWVVREARWGDFGGQGS